MALPFLDAAKDLMLLALAGRLSPGVADYLDLFCDDGVLETPYVSPGSPSRWEGQEAIAAFLGKLRGVIRLAEFSLVAAYPTDDGATTLLEYDGTVHLEKHGTRFRQRYIAVVTLQDGRIALWREYLNPLASQAAVP